MPIYAYPIDVDLQIIEQYHHLKSYLYELSMRVWLTTEAQSICHGGISLVSKASGMSRTTISSGMKVTNDEPANVVLREIVFTVNGMIKLNYTTKTNIKCSCYFY